MTKRPQLGADSVVRPSRLAVKGEATPVVTTGFGEQAAGEARAAVVLSETLLFERDQQIAFLRAELMRFEQDRRLDQEERKRDQEERKRDQEERRWLEEKLVSAEETIQKLSADLAVFQAESERRKITVRKAPERLPALVVPAPGQTPDSPLSMIVNAFKKMMRSSPPPLNQPPRMLNGRPIR
ncbi:hypothetical protein CCP2SC5_170010 [Azospirillaceae bacterium]